ncbi:MAG: hypothetical protein ACREAM_25365 [Blastocatellia bacterium]
MRVDATAYYKVFRADRLKARVAININNLLGKLYYEGVQNQVSILPGAPRNALASVQFVF